uniref:Uncharacterized protein n=1 Tax=Arundo donax TaxID=35708 RepID=A0A0A9BJR7_ARUDO
MQICITINKLIYSKLVKGLLTEQSHEPRLVALPSCVVGRFAFIFCTST